MLSQTESPTITLSCLVFLPFSNIAASHTLSRFHAKDIRASWRGNQNYRHNTFLCQVVQKCRLPWGRKMGQLAAASAAWFVFILHLLFLKSQALLTTPSRPKHAHPSPATDNLHVQSFQTLGCLVGLRFKAPFGMGLLSSSR
jgi:hypothetical protein